MSKHRFGRDRPKVMIIMRGLPGSGKTTRARQLAGMNGVVYATDDFFMVGNEYKFDPSKIPAHHAANQERVERACEEGISPIVVDNTNVQKWETRPYVAIARKHGYLIRFVEADTLWSKDAAELAKRNTHGVPVKGIEGMLSRYEGHDTFNEDAVLASKAPWET